jgi:hypothetical protein
MTRALYRQLTTWPANKAPTTVRRASPFTASAHVTMNELDDELRRIAARDPLVFVDWEYRQVTKSGERPLDGARAKAPGVVLQFVSKDGHPVTIACDRFHRWQDNLRAITLTLHDLRRIDRYGTAASGEQYRGWAQLPSVTTTAMNATQAAEFLAKHTNLTGEFILTSVDNARTALRRATNTLHPDNGGRSGDFALATDAGPRTRGASRRREAMTRASSRAWREKVVVACTIVARWVSATDGGAAHTVQLILKDAAFRSTALDEALRRAIPHKQHDVASYQQLQQAVDLLRGYEGMQL